VVKLAERYVTASGMYLVAGLAGLTELGVDPGRLQELEEGFREREYARLTGAVGGQPVPAARP
jgi:hypothetical protein